MSLRLENLSHRYGSLDTLQRISVQAEPGKITAVLGPNAAGKSTLLKCVIGSERPVSGHVYIQGSQVTDLSPRQLAQHVAYVPQRSTVAAAFTVQDVVELGRYALPRNPSRIQNALANLDLLELAHRPYPALSVGQQQRVTLARALCQVEDNGIMVLDEPTSAMDLKHMQQCMTLLRQLAERGITILLVLHDISMAAQVADAVWLLERGTLVASGSVAEVLQPDRLKSVFHVPFAWIQETAGRRRLVALMQSTVNVDTMEQP